MTVAFPEDFKGQVAHCRAIFAIESMIFEDALPVGWLREATIEDHRYKYDAAMEVTRIAAIKVRLPINVVGLATFFQDTLDSFNEDENEFKRHGDMCIDVFGPKE